MSVRDFERLSNDQLRVGLFADHVGLKDAWETMTVGVRTPVLNEIFNNILKKKKENKENDETVREVDKEKLEEKSKTVKYEGDVDRFSGTDGAVLKNLTDEFDITRETRNDYK